MHFLFNARTNEKIMLNKDVYSIGTFSDSDTRLNCAGSIQIIIKKKRGQVILYKGCGKFQVNRKHTLKKVLEDEDEIFIGKEVFVFSLKEEFDMKKSQIIYNSYLATMDSFSTEVENEAPKLPERKPLDNPVNESLRQMPSYIRQVKPPENIPVKKPEPNTFEIPGRNLPYSLPNRNFNNQQQAHTEKHAFNQKSGPSFDTLLELNEDFTKQLSPILELETLMPMIADIAIKNINGDKALLMLYDEDSKQLSAKASLNFHKSSEELDKIARKIDQEVITGLKTNAVFMNNASITGMDFIDSMIIARISANNTVFGYICIINKIFDAFNDNDRYILELLATQTALALSKINLLNNEKSDVDVVGKLKRYLPEKAVAHLIETNSGLPMTGQLEVCSVLFIDICNFSLISDSLNPLQVVAFLNEYFTIMTKIVLSYNGNINKFIGDRCMAVFGAPGKTPNHALEAALAALEIKKQIPTLTKKFAEKFGISNFNIKMAINSGMTIYGNVGSLQRVDFSVIGETVKIAFRLEETAPPGGILISRSTYENIYSKVKVTQPQKIRLKGKSDLIEIYELLDRLDDDLIMQRGIPDKIDYSVREHVRVAVKIMAMVEKNGKEFQGVIKDISVGGLCLSLNQAGSFKNDDEININFKLNEQISFKNISCIIKHVKKLSSTNNVSNRIVIVVMFNGLHPDDHQKLSKYIEKKCMSWQELPIA